MFLFIYHCTNEHEKTVSMDTSISGVVNKVNRRHSIQTLINKSAYINSKDSSPRPLTVPSITQGTGHTIVWVGSELETFHLDWTFGN